MKICMLAYTFYESDNRVMRYAETLARRGDVVDVFALRKKGQENYEHFNGVNLYRIQERSINEKTQLNYLIRIFKFLIKSGFYVTKRHLIQPYDLIHVHSVPDFEVFAAFIPKLMGAKIILDIHDLVPEFYAVKFNAGSESLFYKLLVAAEKASIAFSNHVIISNHIWQGKLLKRSVKANKCTVILNYPDSRIFSKRVKKCESKKITILYPGTVNHHQGLDIAIKAFAMIKEKVPNAVLHIYGDGPSVQSLKALVKELYLDSRVLIMDSLPIKDIAKIMAQADISVIPKRNDSFGGEAFSTKTLEFMTLGVPIIVSRTKIDSYYFDDSIVKFFEPENVEDLANAMLEMIEHEELRERLVKNALKFVEEYSWDVKKHIYLDLVDSLVGKKCGGQLVRFWMA